VALYLVSRLYSAESYTYNCNYTYNLGITTLIRVKLFNLYRPQIVPVRVVVRWSNSIMRTIDLERRGTMVDRKRFRGWRLVAAVAVCLAFIAFFAWSEHRLGNFQWWHVYVLVGALIIAVLVKLIPRVGRGLKRVMDCVGFEKESSKTGGGVRRDYFMALVPMYFIVSAYLMQASLRDGKLDIVAMTLSIVILAFALYLVIVSFFRALPERWARTTYQLASSLAVIGALVFAIDMIQRMVELTNLGASSWYLIPFFYGGLLVVLGIMVFHLISVSGREW
jgi:hypothetical protein